MADTLLVDSSDIQSDNRIIRAWDNLFDTPRKRGSNIVIPYAAGELYVSKQVDARPWSVGMLVVGDSTIGDLHDELETLKGLLPDLTGSDTTCTLTVQRSGQSDVTADAEYLGWSAGQVTGRAVNLVIDFRLLTGAFT